LGSVDPSSSESPRAGRQFRVPAGPHRLSAVTLDGRVLSDEQVSVRPASEHLYAPASSSRCFWLETTNYGRQAAKPTRRQWLAHEPRFWLIPERVDTWFAPNPTPLAEDQRSTGGSLTALRQGRCGQPGDGPGM
jgi:hypothetical protein